MIPLHTTYITVKRRPADPGHDPYEPYEPGPAGDEVVVASNVRAQISSPSGREVVAGGSQEIVQFSMSCDPVDLKNTDTVLDQTTNEVYQVVWARKRTSVDGSLDHTRASLKQVTGLVSP